MRPVVPLVSREMLPWIFYHPVDDAKPQIQKGEIVLEVCIYLMNILRIFYEYLWIFYHPEDDVKPEIKKGEIILGSLHFVGTFSWGETTSSAPLILFLWIFSLTSFVWNTFNGFHRFWVSWITKYKLGVLSAICNISKLPN